MLMFTLSKLPLLDSAAPIESTRQRGFTLIEMMVVMVLMGLISAVALPNFERWFSSTQQRVDAARIALQVQNLLARAAVLNQSIDVTSSTVRQILVDGKPALDLPEGWRLGPQDKLSVYGSGYCTPGRMTFVSKSKQQVAIEIRDQQCAVGYTLLANAA